MKATSVSVVVPVRNEAPALAEFLRQLRNTLRPGDELIVVDGGSSDDSAKIACRHADNVITLTRPGRAQQMNAGAAAASGDWLWFVHADTSLTTAHRDALASTMLQAKNQWGRFDVRLSGVHPMLRVVAFMMNLRSRLTGIATGDQAIFVRTALFERVGGFPQQRLMEDVAFSAVLRKLASPVCLTPRLTTSSRRWEQHGIVRTIFLMWRLRYRYWRGEHPETLYRQYYRGGSSCEKE